jgi:hypothetical protein
MRLTLRNMLAYMDDILDAEDAELIRKRIEESKPATEQMHRIRDCMRRLRLGSPDLTERGGGLDPNTVAEYLDHQLPGDRVADFEKVCLESDVHLAEVASCHQILALVLGEPAEVDPESRQRMYQLPDLLAAQARAAAEAPKTGPAAQPAEEGVPAVGEHARRPKPAVPDYLRESRGSKGYFWAQVGALAVVLIFLTGLAGLIVARHLGWTLGKHGLERPVAQRAGTAAEKPASKLPTRAKTPAALAQADKALSPAEATPKAAAPAGGSSGKATKPETAAAKAVEQPAATAAAKDLATAPAHGGPGGDAAPAPSEAPVAPPPSKTPAPGAEAARLPGPNVVAHAAAIPPPVGPAAKKGVGLPIEPPAVPPERVGQLLSSREVLVKYSPEASSWVRIFKEVPLMSTDLCLSLPAYRPRFSLGGEIRVQLLGQTDSGTGERPKKGPGEPGDNEPKDLDNAMVTLSAGDPQQRLPGLTVDYGRMVIRPEGKTPARLQLQVAARSGVLTLVDGESTLAIRAVRTPTYKVDPEKEPGPMVVDFFATSGKVLWQESHAAEPVAMNAPVRLTLSDQPAEATAVQRFPEWVAADTSSMLEERASAAVESELRPDRPVLVKLEELAGSSRVEVRWLALRCLAAVGDFHLMVKALGNAPQNRALPFWPDAYIAQLQAGIRRSPRSAAAVRTAMETLHGAEGTSLYELLWRYNAPGEKERTLPSADADRLLRFLEHKDLDFRVLAFWNLKNLSRGGPSYNYKPDDPPNKRQLAAQKWREHFRQLRAGKPSEEAPVAPLPPDEGAKNMDEPERG